MAIAAPCLWVIIILSSLVAPWLAWLLRFTAVGFRHFSGADQPGFAA